MKNIILVLLLSTLFTLSSCNNKQIEHQVTFNTNGGNTISPVVLF